MVWRRAWINTRNWNIVVNLTSELMDDCSLQRSHSGQSGTGNINCTWCSVWHWTLKQTNKNDWWSLLLIMCAWRSWLAIWNSLCLLLGPCHNFYTARSAGQKGCVNRPQLRNANNRCLEILIFRFSESFLANQVTLTYCHQIFQKKSFRELKN